MNDSPRQKKYLWTRTWPGEMGLDGRPLEDFAAYDGDEYAGRIRFEANGPTKGLWQWAGSTPRPMFGAGITPNLGYCKSAALAAKMVEDFWDAAKALRDERRAEKEKARLREQPGEFD